MDMLSALRYFHNNCVMATVVTHIHSPHEQQAQLLPCLKPCPTTQISRSSFQVRLHPLYCAKLLNEDILLVKTFQMPKVPKGCQTFCKDHNIECKTMVCCDSLCCCSPRRHQHSRLVAKSKLFTEATWCSSPQNVFDRLPRRGVPCFVFEKVIEIPRAFFDSSSKQHGDMKKKIPDPYRRHLD